MSQVERKNKTKIELRKKYELHLCQDVLQYENHEKIKWNTFNAIDLQSTPHYFSPDISSFFNDKPVRLYSTTETKL